MLLAGDGVLSPTVPGPHILETYLGISAGVYADPGWEALDDFDGNVSSMVSTFGLSSLQAAVASGGPTSPSAPISMQYSVADSFGNTANAVRLVHMVCYNGEQLCSRPDGDIGCTVNGICDVLPRAEVTVELASGQLLGPDVVFLPQGAAYPKCTAELPLDVVCDQVR